MSNTIRLDRLVLGHRQSNFGLIGTSLRLSTSSKPVIYRPYICMKLLVFNVIAIILLLSISVKSSISEKNPNKEIKQISNREYSHKTLENRGYPLLSDYLDGDPMIDNSQTHHNIEDDTHNLHHTLSAPSDLATDSSDYNFYKETNSERQEQQQYSNKPINNNNDHHQHQYQAEDKSHAININHQAEHVTADGSGAEIDPTFSNIDDSLNEDDVALQPEKEFLTSSLAERTCQLDRGCQRKDRLNNTYLSYCARHKLELLFSTDVIDDIMHGSSETCERVLDEFIRLDEQINKFHESFKTLLQRYNCHNGYSVKWTCNDCRRAYKDWLCTTNLPYYMNGERVKPCLSFCERVEQRCPYLHPITKEQYGGQPAFICKDPNIPFVPEITPNTLHSRPGKCYDLCHLSNDKRELSVDSLSTYDGYCPSKSMIAEQVRDEDVYCQTNNNDSAIPTNLDSSSNRDTTSNIGTKLLPCDHQQLQQQTAEFLNHAATDESGHGHAIQMRRREDNQRNITSVIGNYPLHCEKLNELSIIFDSYKSQPKGHSFSHHDH